MSRLLVILAALVLFPGMIFTQNRADMRSRYKMTQDNDTGEYRIKNSESEWKEILDPLQFEILRRAGTERAFSGTLYNNKKQGIPNLIPAAAGPAFLSLW
jgi:hypothetical protein